MSLVVKIAARRPTALPLIRYLANNSGLHHNQRMVAGSVRYPGPMDDQLVEQVADDIEFNQRLTGAVAAKGHVYHVSLSASADNGQLSDARWADIATDFMQQMRFAGKDLSPVRWTAVNHGVNGGGADHIHIVMSTIRDNGKQVNLHNDMVKASAVATRLEQKYALGVLQSRLALVGAGSVPYTGTEVRRARELGLPEPARVTLERDIRAMAGEARTEAGFVSLMKSSGLLVMPFPRDHGMVTGYAVALPVSADQRPDWFAGGKLAKDLSLPQLRRRWPLNKAASQYAWRGKIDAEPETEAETVTVEQGAAALDELGRTLADATPGEFAEASHDLAGLLAIASRELEDSPGELAAAARDVGSWAQPTVMPLDAAVLSRAGARLFVLSLDPSGERGRSAMFRQFTETMLELYRLHQAQRLRAATRRQVSRVPDDANPAAEVQEDATTLAATGSMLMVMNGAKKKRAVVEGATDVETADGGAEVFGRGSRPARAGDTDLIDRNWFTDARREDQARLASIRERGRMERNSGGHDPASLSAMRSELRELSEKVGLPLDDETLASVHGADMERYIENYRQAAADIPDLPIAQGQYEAVATRLVTNGGATTGAEADVFLASLERKAELRQQAADLANFEAAQAAAKAGEATWIDPDVMLDAPDVENMRAELDTVMDCAPHLSDSQVVDLNQKMHAAGIHPTPVDTAAPVRVSVPMTPEEQAAFDNGDLGPDEISEILDRSQKGVAVVPAGQGPAWASDPKDPRNWDTAGDPVSPRQQFRLAEAGLSAPEIASLRKGEASVVVKDYLGPDKSLPPSPERARKAYDRVQSDAIAAASGIDGAKPIRTATPVSEATTPSAVVTPKPVPKPPLRPQQ